MIAGSAKGRKLIPPEGDLTRPTTDRMKEALFSVLGDEVVQSVFLDLFSGTGAIGVEALSRGAAEACFVDARTAPLIAKNLALTRFQARSSVLPLDYAEALHRLRCQGTRFDIVFMDPPYCQNLITRAMDLILSYKLLKPGGLLAAEHSADEEPPQSQDDALTLLKIKKYGLTVFQFYRL
ncbi:MAG: 16S rRNA (guanine(966)-N(2))-methyltransferase RsmD [Clostridiales bacterium]|nr:16S rRNA (guanine(966)-N(2))-methyltransferase RsmD [Clostridiales bacterium]